MPRDPQAHLFVGIRNVVVAIDQRSGEEVWRAQLRTADYVTVLWDGEALFASNSGEVWRIDPAHGGIMWHNDLKGMGRGLVSLASSRSPSSTLASDMAAEKRRRDTARAAGAAS